MKSYINNNGIEIKKGNKVTASHINGGTFEGIITSVNEQMTDMELLITLKGYGTSDIESGEFASFETESAIA